jgi:hypothetical protein
MGRLLRVVAHRRGMEIVPPRISDRLPSKAQLIRPNRRRWHVDRIVCPKRKRMAENDSVQCVLSRTGDGGDYPKRVGN